MLGLSSTLSNTDNSFLSKRFLLGTDSPSDGNARLRLWLKFNTGQTVTSSPDVDQWTDQTDENNHATQSTAYNKPHADNGALLFDGTNHFMELGDVVVSSEEGFTLFTGINPDSCTQKCILGIGATTAFIELYTAKKLRIKIAGSAVIFTADEADVFGPDKDYVLAIKRESGATGAITVYKNGVQVSGNSVSNAGAITFSSLGDRNEDRLFDGHMYEIAVFENGDLTNDEILDISEDICFRSGIGL